MSLIKKINEKDSTVVAELKAKILEKLSNIEEYVALQEEINGLSEGKDDKKVISIGSVKAGESKKYPNAKNVSRAKLKDGTFVDFIPQDTNGDMPKIGKLITDYLTLDESEYLYKSNN